MSGVYTYKYTMLQYILNSDVTYRKDGAIVARISQLDIPFNTPASEVRLLAWGSIGEEFMLVSDFQTLHEGENVIYR